MNMEMKITLREKDLKEAISDYLKKKNIQGELTYLSVSSWEGDFREPSSYSAVATVVL